MLCKFGTFITFALFKRGAKEWKNLRSKKMASSETFKDFVLGRLEQCAREYLNGAFAFSARKMFGEYCVYISEFGRLESQRSKKVLFLLCDEQVFVKKYEALGEITSEYEGFFALGYTFEGAREHYILDIENLELLAKIVQSTLPYLPTPKPKNTHQSKHTKTRKPKLARIITNDDF